MSAKERIIKEFLMFKKLHTVRNTEAKVTFHFIYGQIVMAARLEALSLTDANHLIDELTLLYDNLESRI